MSSIQSLNSFKSRREWESHIWKVLTNEFAKTTSIPEMNKVLNLLITESERQLIIKRAVAISLLKQGKSYREIGNLLWVSPTTISALQKSIRQGGKYITSHTRRKKKEAAPKTLTRKEWRRFKLKSWLSTLLILPPPPIVTPKRYQGK